MRVLVTGGAGFIGSFLGCAAELERLAAAGSASDGAPLMGAADRRRRLAGCFADD